MKKEVYLCFDIGATTTKVAYVESKNLEIIKRNVFNTKDDNNVFRVNLLEEKLIEEISEGIKNFKILGIGVSTAGSVDMTTGEIILTNKVLLGYVGTNWKKIFESKFSIKTIVLNDAKAAGIAEFENKSFTNGVMVTLGTGFGVAIFVNKKLYTGSNYSAGEVGQMVWPFDNSKIVDFACSAVLTTNKIKEVIKDKTFKLTEYEKIANNKEALKIKEEWMKNVAYTLQFLNFFYDPDLYIVGGGVSKHKELIYEILNFLPKNFKKVEVATRGNDAAIYGLIIAMNQK